MRNLTLLCLAALPLSLTLTLTGCVDEDSGGYTVGCTEGDDAGFKDGYANGFSCSENRYESYDEYAAAIGDHPRPECTYEGCVYYEEWIEGYSECYADSYEDGLSEGEQDAACGD